MTVKELCSKIAKAEGKKHEASIGDVREIVGIICEQFYSMSEGDFANLVNALVAAGRKRAKRRKK